MDARRNARSKATLDAINTCLYRTPFRAGAVCHAGFGTRDDKRLVTIGDCMRCLGFRAHAAQPSHPDPYPLGIGIQVNACEHRECNTGCRLTVCRAGKGDRDHGHRTTFANCVAYITAQ